MSDREKYSAVVRQQMADRMTPGMVDPRRITVALDAKGLYGPEVDAACGVAEPTVDMWETGQLKPTMEQLGRLADLCGVTLRFFSREHKTVRFDVFVCGPSGCELASPDFPADRYELAQKVIPIRKDTLW